MAVEGSDVVAEGSRNRLGCCCAPSRTETGEGELAVCLGKEERMCLIEFLSNLYLEYY